MACPLSLSLLSFWHFASHWGQHVEQPSPTAHLCAWIEIIFGIGCDLKTSVIFSSQKWKCGHHCCDSLFAGRLLLKQAAVKSGKHPGSNEVRGCFATWVWIRGVFVCNHDNHWTHLANETLSDFSHVSLCFEKYDLDDNERQSHNYWECFFFYVACSLWKKKQKKGISVLLCNKSLWCGLLLFLKTPFGIHYQDSICRFGKALIKALTSTWWVGISHFLLF